MILLKGGVLYDGSGLPGQTGDLLLDGGRITAAGSFPSPPDARTIDCAGLAVAPGFIDSHSHSDVMVLTADRAKADQGVTTEVVGNCGFSPYPASGAPDALREWARGILAGDDTWGWRSADDYLQAVERQAHWAGVSSLVGHGSLRLAVMGQRQDPPTEAEMLRLESLLDEALSTGAAGFSTGLMYAPGSSAPHEELLRLCRVVARRGKIYSTHMRSYSWDLLGALDEQITLARQSGCRLQISHLQAVGRANWHKQAVALERLEKARAEGIDVAFDIYPYTAGSTVLSQLLPQRALAGGTPALLQRLADPGERRRIAAETVAGLAQQWEDIFITAVRTPANQPLVGRNLAAIAKARGVEPVEVALSLLVEEEAAVNIVSFNQSEENLRALLTHPFAIVISDGFYVTGRPHPRLYGAFACLLGDIVREKRWLTLADALHRITGKPAARYQMADRGRLAPGLRADVTVFDPATVQARASYDNPVQPPAGIVRVFRGGREILPPPPAA